MTAITFVTFVLYILILTISWRLIDYQYNRHIYKYLFVLKGNNDGNGIFPNDLENGLYYYTTCKLNNIKMLNKSQSHSHPIYYYD